MDFESFENLLKVHSKSLTKLYENESVMLPKLNTSWFGVRQGVEVP